MRTDHTTSRAVLAVAFALGLLAPPVMTSGAQQPKEWPQHSMDRPAPPVVDPGPGALPVPPPHDAILMSNLDAWQTADGKPAPWTAGNGYFEVAPGTGGIQTKRAFGDVQLHIEWATPSPAHGESQDRGNSGVFLMGLYEVQVLDSYENRTYADGSAAAVYGEFPPLVNASRPPGVWQSYDIVFHGPRFTAAGALTRPATMTVFHNGVLVQDHVTLVGPTANNARPPYKAHPEKLPLMLQDHAHKVRFRNIWLREIPG